MSTLGVKTKVTGTFDPKSPSTFIAQSLSTSSSTPSPFNVILAEDGIGCNAEETSALMRVIEARDNFQSGGGAENGAAADNGYVYQPKALCKAYRNELTGCIQQWEARMEASGTDSHNDDDRQKEEDSIDLLKLTHTFLHLCETYLLDDEESDLLASGAGIVTADTVRYLRYNHMLDVNAYVDVDMDYLLDLDQPEQYGNERTSDGTGMTPYWALLRKLVLRGCLEEAWAVLSRHSACKRSHQILASTSGGYVDPSVKEDNEAFALIRALLLSAPIPGGRNDAYDDCLGQEEDDDDMEQDSDEVLGGIPQDAYKQWNVDVNSDSEFNFHAIFNLYKSWKRTIIEMLKSHVPLRNLMRRLPMLQSCIFDVILNTFACFQDVDGWDERLTAELIYVRPQISKEDIHIRASDHMENCSAIGGTRKDVETIIIQTMQGNAGRVIQALNDYGGGSCAALPAAMTALLCNLLVDSGRIELSQLSFDIETELFLSASAAILSSFSMQNHNEVGVRLSTRLLHPHVVPENIRVTATVAEMLCRHWPKSDAETMSLLESCRDSVSRGSRRILDACDYLGFSRSSYYEKLGDVEKSTTFLLRGIEYCSLFGSETNDGVSANAITGSMCFHRLISVCTTSTEFVLDQIFQCLSASGEIDVSVLTKPLQEGRIISDTIANDEGVLHLVERDPSVALLKHVIDLGLNLMLKETPNAANAVIACLQDRRDVDGSMITLAHSGLYGYLLSCAYDILTIEGTSESLAFAKSSFDTKGMQVLLCRYTQYCTKEKVQIHKGHTSSLRSDITPDKMREALGKGLMRAFIAQNAKVSQAEVHLERANDDANTEQSLAQLLGPSL
jgi:hypothetical protein